MSKLGIIGAGAVGSAIAFAAANGGVAREIVLQDINGKRAEAEALDIEHGSLFYPTTSVIGTDDVQALANSDVIIITAGARQKPGQTRIELAADTINIMKSILPPVVAVAPKAKYILVANPVDVITYAAQEFTGLPCSQMFGSGTVLDSSRLRTKLAEATGINVKNVHAYIAGEHGDSEIVLWNSATIGNVPLLDWKEMDGYPALTAAKREEIHQDVRNSAYKVIEGKGATNYAIAFACIDIVESILNDEKRIMPVSSRMKGIEGLENVCLSMPFVVDETGVQDRINSPLSTDELLGLQASAKVLRESIKSVGF